jgi:hypothetical protein
MKTRRLGYNGVLTCLNMRACMVIQDLRVFFIMLSLIKSGFFTRKSERYYLFPDEDEAHRTCKSKNKIPKLMFLCVTCRPRFDNGVCTFDGKIGCFPLVIFERAKSSVNRPARIMEVKPITSITRDVIR